LIEAAFLGGDKLQNGITHAEDLEVVVFVELLAKIEVFSSSLEVDCKNFHIWVDFVLILLNRVDNRLPMNFNI